VDAGGEGVEITQYQIEFKQVDAVGATIEEGTQYVDGDKTSWKHEDLDNAETW